MITVVAYSGFTRQAQDAAFLTTVDGVEKGLRLARNGGGLRSLTTFWDSEVITHPNAQYPQIEERQHQSCLPGDYPATEIFRENECFVVLQTVTPDNTGQRISVMRQSMVVVPGVAQAIEKYVDQFPLFESDETGREHIEQHQSREMLEGSGVDWVESDQDFLVGVIGFLNQYSTTNYQSVEDLIASQPGSQTIGEAAVFYRSQLTVYSMTLLERSSYTTCVVTIS